jgi:glycosyltransferase involved in cell wall biosynthesis
VPAIVGDCGILVPPRRPDLLAEAIAGLCVSGDKREQLGRLARERICANFPVEREWSIWADIYTGILESC